MRRLLLLPLLLVFTGASPAPRPRRIVSLNLCADQYLLALADRDQIVALTRFARDPVMSAAADRAAGLPFTRGSAEEVLALHPDLIVGAPALHRGTMAVLKGRNIAQLPVFLIHLMGERRLW